MEEKRSKKALWVTEDMHRQINIFAATNSTDIGRATEMLIKLGIISYNKNKS